MTYMLTYYVTLVIIPFVILSTATPEPESLIATDVVIPDKLLVLIISASIVLALNPPSTNNL